jgi:UDP-glucose 4-epimerase
MKWLITGGCGFLGTALVKRLVGQGVQNIRVLDNEQVGTRDDLFLVAAYKELHEVVDAPNGVELVVGDILDEHLAVEVCKGCDIVVHFAANTGVVPSVEDPRADCLSNVIGTFNYLEAARKSEVSRFIFASSGAPAGEVEPPIHEELPPHPVSPYGASKLAGEAYCSAYFRTYGLQTVALRFGNVYGPGSVRKSSLVAKFIRRAIAGLPLEIFGDGGQTRDFIFIDDLIDAVMLAANATNIGGETFQIATGVETSVGELTARLVAALNDAGIEHIKIRNAQPLRGDVRRNYADTSKARARLGWQSRTTLEEGLKITVCYFVDEQPA